MDSVKGIKEMRRFKCFSLHVMQKKGSYTVEAQPNQAPCNTERRRRRRRKAGKKERESQKGKGIKRRVGKLSIGSGAQ